MLYEQFIAWLDEQIEDNDRRMEEAGTNERAAYYLGCATAIAKVKEKFFTLTPPPTTLS